MFICRIPEEELKKMKEEEEKEGEKWKNEKHFRYCEDCDERVLTYKNVDLNLILCSQCADILDEEDDHCLCGKCDSCLEKVNTFLNEM